MADMKKLMGGDPGPGDDMKKHAKLKVLKHLKDMASSMMSDDIKGGMAKKVTVASDSTSGLKHGLDKAKSVVDNMAGKSDFDHSALNKANKHGNDGSADSEGLDDHDGDEEESVAMHNEDANEDTGEDMNEEHTPESLDAQIKHLTDLKQRLAMKK